MALESGEAQILRKLSLMVLIKTRHTFWIGMLDDRFGL
jgi:hypothetical protein